MQKKENGKQLTDGTEEKRHLEAPLFVWSKMMNLTIEVNK